MGLNWASNQLGIPSTHPSRHASVRLREVSHSLRLSCRAQDSEILLSGPTTTQLTGPAPWAMLAAHTAAMLAAAASTAAAAKTEASFATQIQATMQALATTIATHAPHASPSQVNPLFKDIQASPFHQGTAPVLAVYMQSLLTNAPPLIIKHC